MHSRQDGLLLHRRQHPERFQATEVTKGGEVVHVKTTIKSKKGQYLIDDQVFDELSDACKYAEAQGAEEVWIQFTPFMGRGFVVGTPMWEEVSA